MNSNCCSSTSSGLAGKSRVPQCSFGIFVDCDVFSERNDVDPFAVCRFVLQNFCFNKCDNSCRQVFLDFSEVNAGSQQGLRSIGFKPVDKRLVKLDVGSHISTQILFWLWDMERLYPKWNPVIILATNDTTTIPFLKKLIERGVNLVILTDFEHPKSGEFWAVSDNICDLANPGTIKSFLGHFSQHREAADNNDEPSITSMLSFKEAQPPYFRNPLARPSGNLPWASEGNNMMIARQVVGPGGQSSALQGKSPLLPEQMALQQELHGAVTSSQIQLTVSTLRKIYTKQTDTFRIPKILMTIVTDLGVDGYNQMQYPKFFLSCVQWCFGGQKHTDNVESFTYKMNKSIAKCLVITLQRRKGQTEMSSDLSAYAVSMVQHILKHAVEFELCLEILNTFEVKNIQEVLAPIASVCAASRSPAVAAKAKVFAEQYLTSAKDDSENQGLNFETESVTTERTAENKASGGSGGVVSDYSEMATSSTYAPGGELNLKQQFQPFSLFHNSESPHPPHVGASTSGIEDAVATLGLGTESSTAATAMKVQRLGEMLLDHPEGVLGAQIPDVYRETYGENLNLQNKKLKDLLLGMADVEIIGEDSAGDKLFRVRSTSGSRGGGAGAMYYQNNWNYQKGNSQASDRPPPGLELNPQFGNPFYGSSHNPFVRSDLGRHRQAPYRGGRLGGSQYDAFVPAGGPHAAIGSRDRWGAAGRYDLAGAVVENRVEPTSWQGPATIVESSSPRNFMEDTQNQDTYHTRGHESLNSNQDAFYRRFE